MNGVKAGDALRVALVTGGYPPDIGGVETHVHALAEGMSQRGAHVEVLTHQHGSGPDPAGAVTVRRFPLTVRATNYQLSLPLWRYVRRHRGDYDIVHTHSYHSFGTSAVAAVAGDAPLIVTPHYHGTGHTAGRAQLHRLYRPVGTRLLGRAARVIAVSGAERRLLEEHFPKLAERITVIPNGTDLGPLQRAAEGSRPKPASLLVIGRLETYKRVDAVLRVMRQLADDVTLTVVGKGPEEAALQAICTQLGVADRVTFAGRVSDETLAKLLVESAVLVSASEHEAFGLTVIDGLAAGAAAVVSDIPAHRDLRSFVAADAPLELVDPAAESAFARALTEALALPRRAVGAVRVPLWGEVVEQTLALYQSVSKR